MIFLKEKCEDFNINCQHWKKESWFKKYCSMDAEENDKAFGKFTTLTEACLESCGVCTGTGTKGVSLFIIIYISISIYIL